MRVKTWLFNKTYAFRGRKCRWMISRNISYVTNVKIKTFNPRFTIFPFDFIVLTFPTISSMTGSSMKYINAPSAGKPLQKADRRKIDRDKRKHKKD